MDLISSALRDLGKKKGEVVEVTVPAGKIPFEIIEISF